MVKSKILALMFAMLCLCTSCGSDAASIDPLGEMPIFGTGSDGAGPASGAISGTKHYSSWTITGGVTVCDDGNPQTIYVMGDLTIDGAGYIVGNVIATGVSNWGGATNGGAGNNGTAGGPGGLPPSASGGVSGGTAGSSNGVTVATGGLPNTIYTQDYWQSYSVSGAAGNGGYGDSIDGASYRGAAGTTLGYGTCRLNLFVGGNVTLDGDITLDGFAGSGAGNGTGNGGVDASGGGGNKGGGGGGFFLLVTAGRVTGSGLVSAKGGNGGIGKNGYAVGNSSTLAIGAAGGGGGGGGGGAIVIIAESTGSITTSVAAGSAGGAGTGTSHTSGSPTQYYYGKGGSGGGGGGSFGAGGAGGAGGGIQAGSPYYTAAGAGSAGSAGNTFIFTGKYHPFMLSLLKHMTEQEREAWLASFFRKKAA